MNRFAKNLVFAFAAQAASMAMSILVALLLPKVIGVEEYAYWQLFMLYSGYVGFFHFGLPDGIYLRYGGTKIDHMDKRLIGSQFRLMLLWQVAISMLLVTIVTVIVHDASRRFVWSMISVYLMLANITWFMGYIFQAANETKIHSKATILSKALFIAFFAYTLLAHLFSFRIYVAFFVMAQGVAAVYMLYRGRAFLAVRQFPLKPLLRETGLSIKIGISLTLANTASSLVLGVGKLFVEYRWGLNVFGILSLSVSLVTFFLQFISQVSMVMFPALRQTDGHAQGRLYVVLDKTLGIVLCGALLFYAPCKRIIEIWLPEYTDSLTYLAILLPICVLDGKMQMLYNTYLKVLRKERMLLLINLGSCLLSFSLCFALASVAGTITMVAYAMLIAIAARSAAAGIYLSRQIENPFSILSGIEFILCTLFVILTQTLNTANAFISYLAVYSLCAALGLMKRGKELKELFFK